METGSQAENECERFIFPDPDNPNDPGRAYEFCTGQSHSTRRAPSRKRTDAFREEMGLMPLRQPVSQQIVREPLVPRIKREPAKEQRKLTLLEKAVSVAKVAANVIAHGFQPLSEEQIAGRLAICQGCEQFTGEKCKLCGCGCDGSPTLLNKLAHSDMQCPHDPPKWGKIK